LNFLIKVHVIGSQRYGTG